MAFQPGLSMPKPATLPPMSMFPRGPNTPLLFPSNPLAQPQPSTEAHQPDQEDEDNDSDSSHKSRKSHRSHRSHKSHRRKSDRKTHRHRRSGSRGRRSDADHSRSISPSPEEQECHHHRQARRSESPDPGQESQIRQILENAVMAATPGRIPPPAVLKSDPFAPQQQLQAFGAPGTPFTLEMAGPLQMQMSPANGLDQQKTFPQLGYFPVHTPQHPSSAYMPPTPAQSRPASIFQQQWQHSPMIGGSGGSVAGSGWFTPGSSVPHTPASLSGAAPNARAVTAIMEGAASSIYGGAGGGASSYFPQTPRSMISHAFSGATSAAMNHRSVSEAGFTTGEQVASAIVSPASYPGPKTDAQEAVVAVPSLAGPRIDVVQPTDPRYYTKRQQHPYLMQPGDAKPFNGHPYAKVRKAGSSPGFSALCCGGRNTYS